MEAVGLILSDGTVVELPNKTAQGSQFETAKADMIAALADETQINEVTFWHSHPSGGVGPSRVDMKQKTPFSNHLVVTLIENEIVPTWY